MELALECPRCGKAMRTTDGDGGHRAICDQCGMTFTVAVSSDGTTGPPVVSPAPARRRGPATVAEPMAAASAIGGDADLAAKPEQTLGRFMLGRQLGAGAMGVVWLAHDPDLDRDVAVKVLPQALAGDAHYLSRFLREARLAAKLSHPNIVTVHQVGTEIRAGSAEKLAYIVMELVDGGSLDKAVADHKPMPWREATRAVRDAAAGLAAAHKLGLIHRDVKPANLMRTAEGVVKVVDFGLARAQAGQTQLTQQGALLGTPAFMAPEIWRHQPSDARSDIYALACTYYYLLTSEVPFDGDNFMSLGYQHTHEPLPDARQHVPDLPDGVRRILAKGANKEPANRYQNAAELAADLEALLASPPGGRRWPMALAGAAGLVLLAFVLYVATNYGLVKVEMADPTAKVAIKVDGDALEIRGLGEPLRLRAGPHDLEVTSNEFQTFTRSFTVKRGATEVLRVTLEPKPKSNPLAGVAQAGVRAADKPPDAPLNPQLPAEKAASQSRLPQGQSRAHTRTIRVPATQPWTATGVRLTEGTEVEITAEGNIEATPSTDQRSYYHHVPPEGRDERLGQFPQPNLPGLALLGRIGEGPVFLVGAKIRFVVDASRGAGELFLGINDDVVDDNAGEWTVRISHKSLKTP